MGSQRGGHFLFEMVDTFRDFGPAKAIFMPRWLLTQDTWVKEDTAQQKLLRRNIIILLDTQEVTGSSPVQLSDSASRT